MRRLKNTRGITLIALVVTIVVLLILAAVSISMLTGENGIISQAQKSKEATEQAKVKEIVDLAINTLISENNGSTNGITPKDIADKINTEYSQYENVYAEDEVNFPTKIIFPEEENREVDVDLSISTGDSDNIYDADVSEEDIAPVDIFYYEIISEAETGATSLESLPTKEARITGIKPEYCNGGYKSGEYDNTNYEILLEDGSKITDTLVVPYQVEIDGEMYKITEANIYAYGELNGTGHSMPNVKTVIYPNTIKKISGYANNGWENNFLQQVILSKNLQEIGYGAFSDCAGLENIEIPSSVTNIGDNAFEGCNKLTIIKIPSSVTSIGNFVFEYCESLISIELPNGLENIGNNVFYNCTSLESIKIPNNVTNIGNYAFFWCGSLTSIEIPECVTKIGTSAFYNCSSLTTVKYTGTMTQWQQISIDSGNTYLTNAKIICTDGTIN